MADSVSGSRRATTIPSMVSVQNSRIGGILQMIIDERISGRISRIPSEIIRRNSIDKENIPHSGSYFEECGLKLTKGRKRRYAAYATSAQ